jgi:hypothetical protein
MESDLADRLGEFDEVDRLAHVAVWFRVDIRGPQMSIKGTSKNSDLREFVRI